MMTSPSTSAVNDPGSIVWPLWPLPTENLVVGALQGFTGRATCSPATAGAAKAGIDQASLSRRHDISINSISAAPIGPFPTSIRGYEAVVGNHNILAPWCRRRRRRPRLGHPSWLGTPPTGPDLHPVEICTAQEVIEAGEQASQTIATTNPALDAGTRAACFHRRTSRRRFIEDTLSTIQ
jgi:hypothetical protein